MGRPKRSKGLVGRIAVMEANAKRFGFDPEEMHKPILKPFGRCGELGGEARAVFASGRIQSGSCDKEGLRRQTSPASVHQMVLTPESNCFIRAGSGAGSVGSPVDASGGDARFGME